MNGGGPDRSLTDAALEREVESLLAVEPSPAFVARVRARVAEQPAPRAWVFRWEFGAAVCVMAIVSSVVAWQSRGPATPTNDPTQASASRAVSGPVAAIPGEEPAAPKAIVQAARTRPARSRPTATTEVGHQSVRTPLVAHADAEAFDLLLSTIRKPDVVLVFSDSAPGPPWLETSSITIEPIAIDPVPPVAQFEGGIE